MIKKASAVLAIALLAITAQAVQAVDVQGYVKTTVPANSDVLVGMSLTHKSVGTFTVNGAPSGTTFAVDETLTSGEYGGGAYYARFLTGDAKGLWSTISSNGTGDLTLNDAIVAGMVGDDDTFLIFKHRTVGDVFPDNRYGVAFTNGTKVLLFSNTASGINRSTIAVIEYQVQVIPGFGTIKGWNGSNGASTVIEPGTMFIVRNSGGDELTLMLTGYAPSHPTAVLIPASVEKDLMITSGYPVPMMLSDSGIGGVNGRKVLTYTNGSSGINKSATDVTEYQIQVIPGFGTIEGWNGGDAGETALNPSEAFIIRVNGESASKLMINTPY